MTDPFESEVIERLERYASGALSPDQAQLARMRDRVVVASLRSQASDKAAPGRRLAWSRRWSLGLALGLLLVASGVAAAESGPGQPFYGIRLAIASVTLPAAGEARERGLAAQLEERLAEAGDAVRSGDRRAVQAALQAYLRTLADLERAGTADPATLAELQRHIDVLRALISAAPAGTTRGLQQALDEAGHASGVVPSSPPTSTQPTPPAHGSPAPSHRP